MEDLLSSNEEGQQRLREAAGREESWLAGHVEKEDRKTSSMEPEVPANTEGSHAAMATTDEVEKLENAETSLRAAILGKDNR